MKFINVLFNQFRRNETFNHLTFFSFDYQFIRVLKNASFFHAHVHLCCSIMIVAKMWNVSIQFVLCVFECNFKIKIFFFTKMFDFIKIQSKKYTNFQIFVIFKILTIVVNYVLFFKKSIKTKIFVVNFRIILIDAHDEIEFITRFFFIWIENFECRKFYNENIDDENDIILQKSIVNFQSICCNR